MKMRSRLSLSFFVSRRDVVDRFDDNLCFDCASCISECNRFTPNLEQFHQTLLFTVLFSPGTKKSGGGGVAANCWFLAAAPIREEEDSEMKGE